MCLGGSPPRDNSADIARQQEEERQARIAAGRVNIENAFKPFNEEFFDSQAQANLDFFTPQLQDQFDRTRRDQILALDQQGLSGSSSGAKTLADLSGKFLNQKAILGDNARAFSNQVRGDVARTKDELFAQNRSAADPSAATASALARAGTFTTPPSFSPLGQVFADVVNRGAQVLEFERDGFGPGFRSGLFNRSATPKREPVVF